MKKFLAALLLSFGLLFTLAQPAMAICDGFAAENSEHRNAGNGCYYTCQNGAWVGPSRCDNQGTGQCQGCGTASADQQAQAVRQRQAEASTVANEQTRAGQTNPGALPTASGTCNPNSGVAGSSGPGEPCCRGGVSECNSQTNGRCMTTIDRDGVTGVCGVAGTTDATPSSPAQSGACIQNGGSFSVTGDGSCCAGLEAQSTSNPNVKICRTVQGASCSGTGATKCLSGSIYVCQPYGPGASAGTWNRTSTSCQVNLCRPGQIECSPDGLSLRRCSDTGGRWSEVQCAPGATCDAVQSRCVDRNVGATCGPVNSEVCRDSVRYRCASIGTTGTNSGVWESTRQSCQQTLTNDTNSNNRCTPGASSCVDENTVAVCNSTGTGELQRNCKEGWVCAGTRCYDPNSPDRIPNSVGGYCESQTFGTADSVNPGGLCCRGGVAECKNNGDCVVTGDAENRFGRCEVPPPPEAASITTVEQAIANTNCGGASQPVCGTGTLRICDNDTLQVVSSVDAGRTYSTCEPRVTAITTQDQARANLTCGGHDQVACGNGICDSDRFNQIETLGSTRQRYCVLKTENIESSEQIVGGVQCGRIGEPGCGANNDVCTGQLVPINEVCASPSNSISQSSQADSNSLCGGDRQLACGSSSTICDTGLTRQGTRCYTAESLATLTQTSAPITSSDGANRDATCGALDQPACGFNREYCDSFARGQRVSLRVRSGICVTASSAPVQPQVSVVAPQATLVQPTDDLFDSEAPQATGSNTVSCVAAGGLRGGAQCCTGLTRVPQASGDERCQPDDQLTTLNISLGSSAVLACGDQQGCICRVALSSNGSRVQVIGPSMECRREGTSTATETESQPEPQPAEEPTIQGTEVPQTTEGEPTRGGTCVNDEWLSINPEQECCEPLVKTLYGSNTTYCVNENATTALEVQSGQPEPVCQDPEGCFCTGQIFDRAIYSSQTQLIRFGEACPINHSIETNLIHPDCIGDTVPANTRNSTACQVIPTGGVRGQCREGFHADGSRCVANTAILAVQDAVDSATETICRATEYRLPLCGDVPRPAEPIAPDNDLDYGQVCQESDRSLCACDGEIRADGMCVPVANGNACNMLNSQPRCSDGYEYSCTLAGLWPFGRMQFNGRFCGDRVCSPNQTSCDANSTSTCSSSGQWVTSGPCNGGLVCDSSRGVCAPPSTGNQVDPFTIQGNVCNLPSERDYSTSRPPCQNGLYICLYGPATRINGVYVCPNQNGGLGHGCLSGNYDRAAGRCSDVPLSSDVPVQTEIEVATPVIEPAADSLAEPGVIGYQCDNRMRTSQGTFSICARCGGANQPVCRSCSDTTDTAHCVTNISSVGPYSLNTSGGDNQSYVNTLYRSFSGVGGGCTNCGGTTGVNCRISAWNQDPSSILSQSSCSGS